MARSLDQVRGLDRFLTLADALMRAHPDLVCVVVGDPDRSAGSMSPFTTAITARLLSQNPLVRSQAALVRGKSVAPAAVAEVFAASDLHVAPSRPFPVARSLLEAMAAGCVVLGSDTEPHREVVSSGKTGLLVDERRCGAIGS